MADRKRRNIGQDLPYKSSNQLGIHDSSTSLQDLPEEIIQRIFGYGSPYNNLPLVNSYFNKLLKFDPEYNGEGKWKNSSLAMEVFKNNYLVSLNQKLDFNGIQKSIDSFKNSIQGYERRYHNSSYLRKMKNNLAMFECNILEFQKQKYGLSSNALSHKAMSVRMLDQVENKFPGVVIHSPEILQWEVDMRRKFCLFSCEVSSYYDDILRNLAERGGPVGNHQEELMLQKRHELMSPYLKLLNVKSPILATDLGLDYGDSIVKSKRKIPVGLYIYGITLDRQWELIIRLEKSGFYVQRIDILVLQTLDNYHLACFQKVKLQKISLKEVLLHVLKKARFMVWSIWIKLMDLEDAYQKIEEDFELNCAQQAIYDNIKDTINGIEWTDQVRNR